MLVYIVCHEIGTNSHALVQTHILGISVGSLVACISMAGTIACRMMGHAGTDSVNALCPKFFQAYVGSMVHCIIILSSNWLYD